MKLFANLHTDEDVSRLVPTLLVARGFDVTTTSEQGMLSKSDSQQLAYAASIERCLLTQKRVDFERLHLYCLTKKHSEIIALPQKNAYEIAQRVAILLNTLTAAEIAKLLHI